MKLHQFFIFYTLNALLGQTYLAASFLLLNIIARE